MRCYLIRHAQTIWNRDNRFQGHLDAPMSPLGLRQVERLGRHFAGRTVHALFTSHLGRSRETAAAITRVTGAEAIHNPGLAEINLGEWEGLTPEEIDRRYAGGYQLWCKQPSRVHIPGAEPLEHFRARARATFEEIVSRAHAPELVIVCHGGVISSLLADWLGADYDQLLRQLLLSNAGISAVEWYPRCTTIMWINDTAHLAGLESHDAAPQPITAASSTSSPAAPSASSTRA